MKTIEIEDYKIFSDNIDCIVGDDKTVINTINAHSYVVAREDKSFRKALIESDVLLPDGEGILLMAKLLGKPRLTKIAGADIHEHLLKVAQSGQMRCFYLGSSEPTLRAIKNRIESKYPQVTLGFYSPPFKDVFTEEDNNLMIKEVNAFNTDFLFVGMTAPKQEKWVNQHRDALNVRAIASIGAVFDFVAETKKRAPDMVINLKMEWLYRALTSWRLTKRYLYSNPIFIKALISEYFKRRSNKKN